MYPHVIAHLLERAILTSVGGEAAHASQGSISVQNALTQQMKAALRDYGVSPRNPSKKDLERVASTLRSVYDPPRYTPPDRLSRILTNAAEWLSNRPYGPVRFKPANDIVEAVERCSSGATEIFDALTVIAQAVPGVTITDWEWNHNPDGHKGALDLLRRLAASPLVVAPQTHLDVPASRHISVDLNDPVITDMAQRHKGKNPVYGTEERRRLTRAYQEESAHAGDSDIARAHQARADDLRRGIQA